MIRLFLLLFLTTSWQSVSADLAVIHVQSYEFEGSFCADYLTSLGTMPIGSENANWFPLVNLSPWDACSPPGPDVKNFSDSAVFVKRYPCTFIEKASYVQSGGAEAVIIGTIDENEKPSANKTDEDFGPIEITVVIVPKRISDKINNINNGTVKIYSVRDERFDYSLIIIWLWAVLVVAIGAYWSGQEYYKHILTRQRRVVQILPASSATNRRTHSNAHQTMMNILMLGFLVLLMCCLLLLLYFFYDYLVYIIIALFAFAACIAMFQILDWVLRTFQCKIFKCPPFKCCGVKVEITVAQIFLAIFCIAVTIYWIIIRKKRYGWVLQDILGTFFCVNILRTLRLPNGMLCTLLMIMLFFYDIFFVFITPYFTKTGESVMVQVATSGGETGEKIPMVFTCPHLMWNEVKEVCGSWGFSVLGFGDVLIPGLLIAYLHGFDLEVHTRRLYFYVAVVAYGFGLIATFGGMYLMSYPQPALLYLVPFTVIPTYIIAFYRREVKAIWFGKPQLSPHYQGIPETALPSTPSRQGGPRREAGQLLQPS